MRTEAQKAHAQRVLDHIHEHPEQHDQMHFEHTAACGTVRCTAGITVALAGQPVFSAHGLPSVRAAGLLGLTDDEAYRLFYTADNEQAVQLLKHVIVGEDISIGATP